jgi:hypothetical protein
MKDQIESIKALIEQNRAIKERTPFLDLSLGGLRTAHDSAIEHEKALEKLKAQPETEAAPKPKAK